MSSPSDDPLNRDERRAAALRANLHRRKAQARSRVDDAAPAPSSDTPPEPPRDAHPSPQPL